MVETTTNDSVASRVQERFRRARGVAADGEWAVGATWPLRRGGLRPAMSEAVLNDSAVLVAETGEPPQELFGSQGEWAAEKIAELRDSGADVFDRGLGWDPWLFLASVFGFAAFFGLVVAGHDVLTGEWSVEYSPARILMPLVLALLACAVGFTYDALKRRWAFSVAIAFVVIEGVALSAGAALFFVKGPSTGPTGSVLWELLPLSAYALLAWAAIKVMMKRSGVDDPEEAEAAGGSGLNEVLASSGSWSSRKGAPADAALDSWSMELVQELRARGDFSEAQIRRIVAEARGHSRETGRTPEEEFGDAGTYARSLKSNSRVMRRRAMVIWGILFCAVTVTLAAQLVERDWHWGGQLWWTGAWWLLMLFTGWRIWNGAFRGRV